MKRAKRILLSLLITALAGGAYFYLELPAINFQSEGFYFWLGLMCVVYLVASGLLGDEEGVCRAISLTSEGLSAQLARLRALRPDSEKRTTALCLSGAALLVILLI